MLWRSWSRTMNCGKTFMLKSRELIYDVFSNPANDKYAWVGADTAEIMVLQDFRWCRDSIPWKNLYFFFWKERLWSCQLTQKPIFYWCCHQERHVPDQGSELNQGCAGLNQGSAVQMLNRGNRCWTRAAKQSNLLWMTCVSDLMLDEAGQEAEDICALVQW